MGAMVVVMGLVTLWAMNRDRVLLVAAVGAVLLLVCAILATYEIVDYRRGMVRDMTVLGELMHWWNVL